MKRCRRGLILGGTLLLGSAVLAQEGDGFDDLMNRPPWAACTYCHGDNGAIDDPTVPALAGQSPDYLRKQIADFRAGRRIDPSGMMTSALFLLDPKDDIRVSQFFARQTRNTNPTANADQTIDNEIGKTLFWHGDDKTPPCASCHLEVSSSTPKLDGLNAAYTTRQLKNFRSGQRTNDDDAVMRKIASSLDDKQIEEVSRFIADR